jgi:Trk K+ transport system NAD-binding subunit
MAATRGLTRPIIVGRRFVISGLSRLTVRVARLLSEERAEVVVVASEAEQALAPMLGDTAQVVWDKGDHELALREAGLSQAGCFLVLGEDDRRNMRSLVIGSDLAPAVPVILRMFNPVLAEHFQRTLPVRQAYSVSALAAPAFVAAALEEEVLETLHLGDDEVPIGRVVVNRGSPMDGRSVHEVERRYGVTVLAHRVPDGWRTAAPDERLDPDEEVLLGGPLMSVLRLALEDSAVFHRHLGAPHRRRRRPTAEERRKMRERRRATRAATLLPTVGLILLGFLVTSVVAFGIVLGLDPVEALYHTILTAFGEQTLGQGAGALKVLAILTMVAGGAFVGIVISHLASVATARVLADRAGRRTQWLVGHVVVAGLTNVGFRVAQHLRDLDLPVVVVDPAPDGRLREALGESVPVVAGDASVPEILERAGIAGALCLIGCHADELTNVLACIQGRRMNERLRTVARVFDEQLGDRLGSGTGVDRALSATSAAAGAFASAASNERAVRPVRMGGLEYRALRYDVVGDLTQDEVAAWAAEGIRVLAYRVGRGPVRPGSELTEALGSGDSAVVAGPEAAVESLILAS